jgi:hypothetical protein
VHAIEDCTLLTFSHDDFKSFCQKQPRAAAELLRVFSKGLAERVRASASGLIRYGDEGKLILEKPADQEKHRLVHLLKRLIGVTED